MIIKLPLHARINGTGLVSYLLSPTDPNVFLNTFSVLVLFLTLPRSHARKNLRKSTKSKYNKITCTRYFYVQVPICLFELPNPCPLFYPFQVYTTFRRLLIPFHFYIPPTTLLSQLFFTKWKQRNHPSERICIKKEIKIDGVLLCATGQVKEKHKWPRVQTQKQ